MSILAGFCAQQAGPHLRHHRVAKRPPDTLDEALPFRPLPAQPLHGPWVPLIPLGFLLLWRAHELGAWLRRSRGRRLARHSRTFVKPFSTVWWERRGTS